MIPIKAYDDAIAKCNKVGFLENKNIHKHIKKYLYSFSFVNGRTSTHGEEYKYERVCLLIVDFSKRVPVVYSTDNELKAAGLLAEDSEASIDNMNFATFASSLMTIYEKRFGTGRFI